MDLSAEDYYSAAIERLEQARRTYAHAPGVEGQTDHALTIYIAGVAVEYLLRGFVRRKTPNLNTGHDLDLLFDQSRLGRIDPGETPVDAAMMARVEAFRQKASAAISTLRLLWANQLRYVSEERMKTWLQKRGNLAGFRGDAVRECARRSIEAATIVIEQGTRQWKRSATS